jgi:SAM-dependent methyltransferase
MGLRERYDDWHDAALAQPGSAAATEEERRFFAWVLAPLAPTAGASLLDVACGAGAFAEFAAGRGLRVTGMDLSDVAVEAARARVPNAEFVAADAEALPFEDGAFERVTCLGSLEHFPHPDAGAAEMRRVLAPGGRALVFVPNLFFLGHIWFGLRHGQQPTEGEQGFSEEYLSSGAWTELLERAGFEVVAVRPWNKIHASGRVSPIVKRLWNAGARFVPLNGAYAFGFVCTKR